MVFQTLRSGWIIAILLTAQMFAQAPMLDDFEGTMRTFENGTHKLWEVYDGEGGTGSTSLTTGAARNGSKGLQEVLTAGTLYMHYYPYDGANWKFAHNELVAGTWTTNFYNRMSFWVWHPSTMPAATANNYNIELGTYTRCKSCDPATQNAGGTHYYHFYNVLPGVWTYVIVDNHPQHSVGGPKYDPGVITSPTTDGPTWNYFDSLTRWYWNAPYISPTKYPATFYWDTVQFYKDPNVNEDVANIASMEASYNASTNKLHVGFVRNSSVDTTYTARYAFSDIWQLGFANASLMGSVGPDGEGDYANKKIESTSLALAGKSAVYIAVQKQGSSVFRQIQLLVSSSGTPPPPPPIAVCSDTIDNDSDGLIDFPADSGCSSASDTTEANVDPPPPSTSGPAIVVTTPAGRILKLTRRAGNTNKQLPMTINKDDCLTYNGTKVAGGLNCP